MQIVIQPNGRVHCIYDETIQLSSIGQPHIRRASTVEPTDDGRWVADLSPTCGPKLGPFEQRSQALAAEVEWLIENWLPTQATS